ncbi:MAG: hypothetical protein WAT39_03065 [Planctomycetota bacterium]
MSEPTSNPPPGHDRERLLDAALAEQFADAAAETLARRLAAATPREREAAWQRASAAERDATPTRHRPWWLAAAALLGVLVVAATMQLQSERQVTLRRPQDPVPERVTKPRDLAHFVELAGSAKALRITGSDTIGATLTNDATGSYDRLDVVRWPEVLRIESNSLAAWQKAIAASPRGARNNKLGELLTAHFELPDGSVLVAGLSAGDEVHLDALDGPDVVQPDAALRALIQEAHAELALLHRRAAGIAHSPAELAALPADTVHVAAPCFADGSLVAGLRRFRRLTSLAVLAGDGDSTVNAAVLLALSELRSLQALELPGTALRDQDLGMLFPLSSLQRLTIRGGNALTGAGIGGQILGEITLDRCQGLTAAGLRALAQNQPLNQHLHTLRLVDCDLGPDQELLAGLPAFPSLQALFLRGATITGEHLAPLLHTKLRMLVVDAPLNARDLARFAALPSLRVLAVLSPALDDAAVSDLATLRQLQILRMQNTRLTTDGLQQLRRDLPCSIQCVPGQRVFNTRRWLDRA